MTSFFLARSTLIVYSAITLVWLLIFILIIFRTSEIVNRSRSMTVLSIVMLTDSFRTVLESIFFGSLFSIENDRFATSLNIHSKSFYDSSHLLIPKLFTLATGIATLYYLKSGWFPAAEQAQLDSAMRRVADVNTKLAAQSEILQAAIESMDPGILMIDSDQKVTVFNSKMLLLLGIPRHIMEREVSFKEIGDYQRGMGEFDNLAVESRETIGRTVVPISEHTYERMRPNGTILEIRSCPLPGGGMVRTYTDVTSVRQLAKLTREAQQLESLGQLTSGMAHDFNNLLAVIMLNAEDIIEHNSDLTRIKSAANTIHTAALSGSGLTRGLLAYARKQILNPRPIIWSELMQPFGVMARSIFGRDIAVNITIDENVPPIQIDPSQFSDALLNLAFNARDAMADGGVFSISVSKALSSDIGSAMVEIIVSDTGCGMAPAILAKVTEPFFTTKGVGVGSGLGLSMVDGFVRQSGGTLQIQSTPGDGTSISMLFPVFDGEIANEKKEKTNRTTSKNRLRILIVDDNIAIQQTMSDILESVGHSCRKCSSADEALQLITKEDAFDLIITDIKMPGQNTGIDLATFIIHKYPHIKVILITGYLELEEISVEDHKIAILQKPFSRMSLMNSIDHFYSLH